MEKREWETNLKWKGDKNAISYNMIVDKFNVFLFDIIVIRILDSLIVFKVFL